MFYYEIKDTKTGKQFQATAKNFQQACEINGHKVRDCKCIWKANIENAPKKEDY